MSAMGSVIMVRFDPLPACFPDARDFTLKRILAETNSAEAEFSDERTRAPASVTAIAVTPRKLGLAIVPFDQSLPGHRLPLSELVGGLLDDDRNFPSEGKAHRPEQGQRYVVFIRRGHHGDIHPVNLTHFVEVDLRKNDLLPNPHREVPATVERARA